jgi:protein-disulfide isomerase
MRCAKQDLSMTFLLAAGLLASGGRLEARQPPTASKQPIVLRLERAPIKGSTSARVVLVEVSDFECPFCARYVRETKPHIEFGYVQTGRIRYAFLNMPVEARHKNAFKAAEAAKCAGDQGKFWEMHDRLFMNQTAIAPIHLPIHAQILALNPDAFRTCLGSGRHAADIRRDFAVAQQAGVTGTPAFLLGIADPGKSEIRIVNTIVGAKSYQVMRAAIDALLASTAASQK